MSSGVTVNEDPTGEIADPRETGERRNRAAFRPLVLLLLAALVLYVAGALVIAGTRGVWSPDCGARMIQVLSMMETPPQQGVPYPAQDLDPEHRHSSLYFYEFRHEGRTFIFYSILFAVLSALGFKALGFPGLMVLPILGGLTATAATWGVARLLGMRVPWAPALLVALASPVAVYSTVFWDHSLTSGLAAVALYLALRGAATGRTQLWFWAGLVLGAGLWFHELVLPYVPALVLAAWWLRRDFPWVRASLLLAAGTVVLAVPLGFFNEALYGTPLGPHLSNNHLASAGSIFSFLTRPAEWIAGSLYTLFFWGNNCAGFTPELIGWLRKPSAAFRYELRASTWMAVPMLLWLALSLSGRWIRAWPLSLLAMAGLGAAGIFVFVNKALPHSMFLASPVLAMALAAPLRRRALPGVEEKRDNGLRQMLQAVALATAFYCLPVLIKPTLGGTEWGARHLLLIVPALALMAWSTAEALLGWSAGGIDTLQQPERERERLRRSALLGGMAALLVLSLALQGRGFQIALTMHQHSQAITRVIESTPDDVIVSSVWWAPLQAPAAYFKKRILYAGDPEHPAPPLFRQAREAGVGSYTLIGYGPWDLALFSAQAGYAPLPNAARSIPFNLYLNRFRLSGERTGARIQPADGG